MNTELQYAYFQDRFEPYQYNPIQIGNGVWFNPNNETYAQAIDRAKAQLMDKVIADYPHLAAQLKPVKPKIVVEEGVPVVQKLKENVDVNHINALKDIMNCDNIKILETFKIWAESNGAIETYNLRLEQLTQKETV